MVRVRDLCFPQSFMPDTMWRFPEGARTSHSTESEIVEGTVGLVKCATFVFGLCAWPDSECRRAREHII